MINKIDIDWILVLSLIPLLLAGFSVIGLGRQIVWVGLGFLIFFLFSRVDWRFLKTSGLLFLLFIFSAVVLTVLLLIGETIRGSSSWFDFVFFSVEPAEPAKLLLILILAKYFTRRHIEIAQFKHILISGFYAVVPAVLVFLQPDFGSSVVFVLIWLGMIMVSGTNKKHLLFIVLLMILIFTICWFFVLKPYQKDRISSFINPLKDPQGAGYNALQSMVAIGSGQVWGKGVGYGTQSRLEFLPEYKTDFVFAAFAEEWGLIGVLIIFFCFGFLVWRILKNAYYGQSNFERFYGIGLTIFLMTHFILHVGMNVGLLPITGLNMPFLSYGGSHLITIFAGLGILMGMRKYSEKPSSQVLDSFDV
ncbi:FtsW/RodA/SpoVE family cell cycle protein [Patescibacteria group bacterium]